ncbi:MAG: septum formation initiator family protein [Candidatus Gastranaerophilales bacterium]|nr:septum formation initiator family protein [Candidatus Gastranaerophilales bacterium]
MEIRPKKQKSDTNLAAKVRKKSAKHRHHTQFYYSFLTIILLICLVQMSISALLNVTKVVAYHRKISTLESKQIAAEAKNAELKKDIKNFSTTATMESIARNNLKMAGKDEVLVIVNKQQSPQENQKHKKIGFKNNEKFND